MGGPNAAEEEFLNLAAEINDKRASLEAALREAMGRGRSVRKLGKSADGVATWSHADLNAEDLKVRHRIRLLTYVLRPARY